MDPDHAMGQINANDRPDFDMQSESQWEDLPDNAGYFRQMQQMMARAQETEQKMAKMLGDAERMNDMMAQANARAERAETEARSLSQQLETAQRRTAQNESSSGGQDVSMRLIKGKDKEQDEAPKGGPSNAVDVPMPHVNSKVDDPYDAGDESDQDEAEEMDDVLSALTPVDLAGIQFPRTMIGAGPVLRLKAMRTSSNASTSATPTGTPNINLPHGSAGVGSEVNLGSLERTISSLTACVAHLAEKLSSTQTSRTKKYGAPKSRQFKLPPQRFTTPDRNARLASVRELMNALFDITKDADILVKPLASAGEIRAFRNDETMGPTSPYLPDFSDIKGAWNHALLLIFMEEYTKKFTINDEEDQEDISDMFFDRVFRLRKKAKQGIRLPGETDGQLSYRCLAKHTRVLRQQRRNSRRNEIFETRSRITVQNMMAQRGEPQAIWEHLDGILEALGAGGMSSDESELESDGRKVYFVKRVGWRRKSLTARMIIVDRDRNVKTAYNNTRPGNPPRLRKRRNNPTETARNALPGLPSNFYDPDWYKQLTDRQRKELRAGPVVDLLEIEAGVGIF